MIQRIPKSGTMLTGLVVATRDGAVPSKVLLFAHGIGEKGDGSATSLEAWFKRDDGAQLVAMSNEANIAIIAPQLIDNNWSNKYFDFAYSQVQLLQIPQWDGKVYTQGLSWGGQLIWNWSALNQHKVINILAVAAVYPYPNEPTNWGAIKTPAIAIHAKYDPTVPYGEGLNAINKINAVNNPDNAKMIPLELNYHEIWKRDVYSNNEIRAFYGLPAAGGGPINPPSTTLKADASATQTQVTGSKAVLDATRSTGYKNQSSVSWANISSPQGATWDIWDMPNNGKIGLQVNLKNLIPGQYTFEVTVSDSASNTSKDRVTINVSEQEQPPAEGGDAVVTGKQYKAKKPDGTYEIVTLEEVQ